MKKLLTSLALIMVGAVTGCQQSSISAETVDVTEDTSTATPIEVVPAPQPKLWTCPTCSSNEQYVLKELQVTMGITDKNALATIMGNIKQESKFIPNICEGGARVNYENCYSGGYGLIQWTTPRRYRGLGFFGRKFGCDPSTLYCQTRYMFNEIEFQKVLPEFRNPGQPVRQYMVPSYYWLGWGIEGPRLQYSYDYTKAFVAG